jgi:hypothetical protein
MNKSAFAKISLSIALSAIVSLAVLAVGQAGLVGDGMVDPFQGASRMPGDLASSGPSHSAEPNGAKPVPEPLAASQ